MKKKFDCVRPTFALVLALAMLSCCGPAVAEDGWKPDDSVNMIVGFAPGGGNDIIARAIAQYIDLDGESMYVTNIEGGNSSIAVMEVYNAENDGLTLMTNSIETLADMYYNKMINVDAGREMKWVACIVDDPFVFAVSKDSPYESFEQVLSDSQSGKELSVATGAGKVSQEFINRINEQASAEFTYVPYEGGAKARTAVMGGHVDLACINLSELKSYVDSGELRLLATLGDDRAALIPDIPTLIEFGIDVPVYGSTRSILMPPDTDEEVVQYYRDKLKAVFDNEEFRKTMLETMGYNLVFLTGEELDAKVDSLYNTIESYLTPTAQ